MAHSKAILRYPPEFDGELHIDLFTSEVTDNFDLVTITMKVASRKPETLRDLIRRVGREMESKPLTIMQGVK